MDSRFSADICIWHLALSFVLCLHSLFLYRRVYGSKIPGTIARAEVRKKKTMVNQIFKEIKIKTKTKAGLLVPVA